MDTEAHVAASLSEQTKSTLVRNLVILILITSGAIGAVFLIGGYRAVNQLSSAAIKTAADRTETDMKRFFEPVESHLAVQSEIVEHIAFDITEAESLNKRFIPVLKNNPQITSLLLARDDGAEYLLLKDGEQWRNRMTNRPVRGDTTLWYRWDKSGKLIEETTKELDYDPRKRPWYQGAAGLKPRQIWWTQPYSFFTTKDPGITASNKIVNRVDNQTYVLAMDVMLQDVSAFTAKLAASDHGYASVLTEDNRVLGLPHDAEGTFGSVEARRAAVLSEPSKLDKFAISDALQALDNTNEKVVKFNFDGHAWWAGVRPYVLGETDFSIVVMVPNSDYVTVLDQQRNMILFVTLLALLAGIGVGVHAAQDFRRKLDEAVKGSVKLGQYTIESKIGSGGMGDVYRASHAMLRRPTAIKLLKPEVISSSAVRRFEREVQLTCRLTHPNTIIIYDYGRTPDGVFYYAMEFLEGMTTLDLVNLNGPIPAARVIYLMLQVCDSLNEAHEIGLIHRDIKPSNIFVTNRGGHFDFVKVLDFGLVREFESTDSLDQTNNISGTPGFMSPEAFEDPNSAAPAADIYAVGAVAYMLLTGRSAFEGHSAVAVLVKQSQSLPEMPSLAVDFDIPDDLEALIMHCLQPDPVERPKSMRELISRFEACADAGNWTPEDAFEWWNSSDTTHPTIEEQALTESFDVTVDLGMRS